MNPALPASLSAALEALAEGRSSLDLTRRAQAISRHYRSGGGSRHAILTGDDALAYALTRMPATYAAVRAALEALTERAPDFAPTTVTDVGCGPGTASWAALDAFDGIERTRLLDNNPTLLTLAGALLSETGVQRAYDVIDLAGRDANIPSASLVVAAYVLTELDDTAALSLAERMWAAARGALVMVEPGTPAAWARLITIRVRLIDRGAIVVAPCPHHAPCPLAAPDWCHFAQRLPRSRAHRRLKAADAPFEDEKFAYLAVVRPSIAVTPARARVLAPPGADKAAVSLKLCEPSGALALRRVARRHKDAYRAVRRAGWGDTVEG